MPTQEGLDVKMGAQAYIDVMKMMKNAGYSLAELPYKNSDPKIIELYGDPPLRAVEIRNITDIVLRAARGKNLGMNEHNVLFRLYILTMCYFIRSG